MQALAEGDQNDFDVMSFPDAEAPTITMCGGRLGQSPPTGFRAREFPATSTGDPVP